MVGIMQDLKREKKGAIRNQLYSPWDRQNITG
jgi:hypothetical protein